MAKIDPQNTVLLSGRTYDPKGDIRDFIKENNINLIVFPELVREISLLNDIKAFFKIYKYIKKNSFNIVHTHSSKAGILGRWAAWLAKTKIIVHTPHGHIFYGYFNPIKSRFFIILEKITALITNRIITLTKKGIEDHVRFGISHPEKFVHAYSGIDMNKFKNKSYDPNKKKELGISDDRTVIGTVSRLDPVKGNKYFIEAIKCVKDKIGHKEVFSEAIFLIIGDGSQREEIEEMIEKYGIKDKVILTGMREDVASIFPLFDIFVLSSLMEGMGRVLLEVMVHGKPIIASDVGGIPELVQDGKTGILVPPKDAHAIADAVIRLLEDKDLRNKMGENAGLCVNEIEDGFPKFGIEAMVNRIKKIYDNELERIK